MKKNNVRHTRQKVPLIPILFFTTLFTAALLYLLNMNSLVAKQIISDVERYKSTKGLTPTVVQLKKFSSSFRNVNHKECPCYRQISANDYEIWYYQEENQLITYRSKSGQWQ